MSEQYPLGNEDTPLGSTPDASDFEIWEAQQDLAIGLKEMLEALPISRLTGDLGYWANFTLIVEEDGELATTGYVYDGEFVELAEVVEEEQEPYMVLRDVCCYVEPQGKYAEMDPEDIKKIRNEWMGDHLFISRHKIMRVPFSRIGGLTISVKSRAVMEEEFAKYRSPAELLMSDDPQT